MPESIGPTVLLASGRLCRRVAINRSDRHVYIDSGGHAVCEHGERKATIATWLAREQQDPDYKRPSLCDCVNVDGLCTKYAIPPEEWPVRPEKPLYHLLGDLGVEQKAVSGRPQRLAFRTATVETWVRPSGCLVCQHGNSRRVLKSIVRACALEAAAMLLPR